MNAGKLMEKLKEHDPSTPIAIFDQQWRELHEVSTHETTQDKDRFTLCPPDEGVITILLMADYS